MFPGLTCENVPNSSGRDPVPIRDFSYVATSPVTESNLPQTANLGNVLGTERGVRMPSCAHHVADVFFLSPEVHVVDIDASRLPATLVACVQNVHRVRRNTVTKYPHGTRRSHVTTQYGEHGSPGSTSVTMRGVDEEDALIGFSHSRIPELFVSIISMSHKGSVPPPSPQPHHFLGS